MTAASTAIVGAGLDPLEHLGGPPAARGTVYLVGGGPGALGLVTARAAMLLSTADVVAFDRLAPSSALALCQPACELIDVGKQPDRHPMTQPEIDELLVTRATAGQAVVRFKGGDPFVFGRGSEEALRCVDAGVPFEVVPGVTSAVAAPAFAGIPVTHRGIAPAFAVVTGHEDPTKPETQVDHEALARFPGTLLFLMGVRRIGKIAAALVQAGKPADTPVAMVRWGSTPKQSQVTGTLATIADEVERSGFSSPAVTVIGDVARLTESLGWFDRRPLHGRTVLVPRTRQQASRLSGALRALGAEPIEAPTIAIEPTIDPDPLADACVQMRDGAFAWVAFTSPNGVRAVMDEIYGHEGDARWFARVRVACIGPGTAAALREHGIVCDAMPQTHTTRALGLLLAEVHDDPSRPILLPRADIASETLREIVTGGGVDVVEVEAYRTVLAPALDTEVARRLLAGELDAVALGSSSTVRNLVELLGARPHPSVKIVSIGPVTSATCRDLGMEVAAEADPHDIDGLVAAVVAALGPSAA